MGLPLSRTRRSNLTAADGLTSKREAAWRIDDPPSTARTIRSRRSREKGAGMGRLAAEFDATPESAPAIPRKRNPL